MKLRFPARESVKFEDFLLICTVFPHVGPFRGEVKPNLADKNFMDTQTSWESFQERFWKVICFCSSWYHGPRNNYINSSQKNNSCDCTCNLAAKMILKELIYVIASDTFYNGKQRHLQTLFLSTMIYVIVIATWQQKWFDQYFLCMQLFCGWRY